MNFNDPVELVVFFLAVAGLTLVLSKTSLVAPFRDKYLKQKADKSKRRLYGKEKIKHFFYNMMSCPICCGFHATYITYLYCLIVPSLAYCFAGAIISYGLVRLTWKD